MKKFLRVFFEVLIIIILIYLLRKIDFKEAYELITSANLLYLLLAFSSCLLSFVIFNLRSMYSLRSITKMSFWFSMKTTLADFFVNGITPGAQLGGDPVRAYFIGKKYNKSKTKVFGALLADRFFHVIASVFFIVLSLLFILINISIPYELKIIFQTVLFFIFGVVISIILINLTKTEFNLVAFVKKIKWLNPRIKRGKKEWRHKLAEILLKHFGNFTKAFKNVATDKKKIFVGLLLSLVHWMLIFLTSYYLFLSLGTKVGLFLVIVGVSLGGLVGEVSPSPGGAGLIEGVMVFVYSLLGVNLALALAVTLLSRIMFYFFSLLLGGISLVHLEHSAK